MNTTETSENNTFEEDNKAVDEDALQTPDALKSVSELPPELKLRYERKKNRNAIRWYVMVIPGEYDDKDKQLKSELAYRRDMGEPVFEYFAPTYRKKKKATTVKPDDARFPLLYNYVFIHASETEIKRMKRNVPQYSFLRRKKNILEQYPYLSDRAMQNLRCVAEAYSGDLPAYIPNLTKLIKGDRVRITEGTFAGIEASVIRVAGTRQKEVVVCLDDLLWVPLLHVTMEQCEMIAVNGTDKQFYAHLDNDKYMSGLHNALQRYHNNTLTEDDTALATEALKAFKNIETTTDILRCKLYTILLMAYTILDDAPRKKELLEALPRFILLVKAEQSKALLTVTIYGCTNDVAYYHQAHDLIMPWAKEAKPKKSKRLLITHLNDYDEWLKHKKQDNLL